MKTIDENRLQVRVPRMADAPAVAGLINICAIVEIGAVRVTVGRVRREWQIPGFDLQTDAWLVVAGQGQAVGFAVIQDRYPHVCPAVRICVHPGYIGRGVGTRLLALAEERARHRLYRAPAGMRVALYAGAWCVNQMARRLLYGQGYRLVRRFWRVQAHGDDRLLPAPRSQRASREAEMEQVPYRYDVYEKELRPGMMQPYDPAFLVDSVNR